MTGDERLNAFIDSLDAGNTPFLHEIEMRHWFFCASDERVWTEGLPHNDD